MQPEKIIEGLKTCSHYPQEAIKAALAQKATVVPLLLHILQNTVTNYKDIDSDQMDFIFALYLLAKFKETAAFPYVIQLANLPEKWPEELLGDCISEGLPQFIISTFNGDLNSIKQLIENRDAYEWSRIAALNSLLGLFVENKLTRNDIIEYFRHLFQTADAKDKNFNASLVLNTCDLYPIELQPEILEFINKKMLPNKSIDQKIIDAILKTEKEKHIQENVYENTMYHPIHNIEKAMSWMEGFSGDQENQTSSAKKIGRNDACPCGSNKKYKKCCLPVGIQQQASSSCGEGCGHNH